MNIKAAVSVFVGALLIMFATGPSAPSQTGEELVQQVLANPGAFNQICAEISWGPLPLYSVARRDTQIASTNYQKLREQRTAVVAELVQQLNHYRPIPSLPNVTNSPTVARDPNFLMMLVDLNAVEALGDLLRIEAVIHAQTLESPLDVRHKIRRDYSIRYHRDLLGVIAGILRQEKYQPLLKSELEKEFHSKLQARVQAQETLTKLYGQQSWSPDQRDGMSFDPIYRLPYGQMRPIETDYTEPVRSQIVVWGNDFLRDVPPGKRMGIRGMIPQPVTR